MRRGGRSVSGRASFLVGEPTVQLGGTEVCARAPASTYRFVDLFSLLLRQLRQLLLPLPLDPFALRPLALAFLSLRVTLR